MSKIKCRVRKRRTSRLRTNSPEQIDHVVRLLKAYGFVTPILVDQEKRVIDGWAVVMAAKKLGLSKIPVVCNRDLSDVELRALKYRHTKVSGPDVGFKKKNKDVVPLDEHLAVDPFIVRYADGTYSYNCYHIPTSLNAGRFPAGRLESWPWKNIPLNRESMGKTRAADTIQHYTFQRLKAEFDLVFNDDGSGEAAHLVRLKEVDEKTIRLPDPLQKRA